MKLDGFFIDMYGTLTGGDRAAVENTCRQIVADTNAPITPHELAITWGDRFFHAMDFANEDRFLTLVDLEARTLHETMAQLDIDIDPRPYVQRLVDYWRDPPLQPETRTFLERCPLPVCIVSNADRNDVDQALDNLGLRVHALITSQDARSYKPHRQIFEDALQLTGWRRDRVWHIGDSLHSDVGGALVAQLTSVWINRAHRIHDIGNHQPDYECTDLRDILKLLNNPIR